ncbi:hypothetical protein PUV47_19840, partial [Pseudovibrio exalbescens]|nr:hypothetical protein [Pseudovibrio exalbescens]
AGQVWIQRGGELSGEDAVVFRDLTLSELSFDRVTIEAQGDILQIRWGTGEEAGVLRLSDMGQHIERFEFADGTVLREIKLREDGRVELKGTEGDDVIIGSEQNDYIHGGSGDDILDPGAGT